MANAAKLAPQTPVRMLLMGYPGAGKTGALASLANAGYKLRIMDFDGNPESLLQYTRPEMLPNIDIVSLEDPIGDAGDYLGVTGLPRALTAGVRLLKNGWKYEDPDGVLDEKTGKRWVDLGKHTEWGMDTILVIDGLSGVGKSAMRRAEALSNRTPKNRTQGVWGLAMQDVEALAEIVTDRVLKHHTIFLAHLKMIGPKEPLQGDDPAVKAIKKVASEMVPTRIWPAALGRELPQNFAQHFPVAVLAEPRLKGNKVVRQLTTLPREEIDLKLPALNALGEYQLDTGLLDIFKALGQPGKVV